MRFSRTFLVTPLLLATAIGCGINTEGSLDTDTIQAGGAPGQGGKGGAAGTIQVVGGSAGQSGQGGGGSTQANCTQPSDCDDNSSCTIDACVQGTCQHTALPASSSCTDGNKCNGEEICNNAGLCVPGTPIPVDDDDGCTADLCDPVTGTVSHKGTDGCKPCPNGDSDCDDKNVCTVEMCIGGTCHYSNAAVGTQCDDGNPCTDADQCTTGGSCQGTGKQTSDNNTCTVDSCDLATGVVTHTPIDQQPCNDNDICTENDTCNSTGQCAGTDLPSIDDGDGCTTDICDPVTGTVTHKGQNNCKPCTADAQCDDKSDCTTEKCSEGKCVYSYKFSDDPCDDGNKCTENDLCDGTGTCKGTNKSFEDNNPCTNDVCDPQTGESKHSPLTGQSCDDTSKCTENDTCDSSGKCKGTPKATNDGSDCTNDTCVEATGEVTHTPIPNCKACVTAADCNDGNPCTTETCQNAKCNYANVAANTACDDAKKCTSGDKCDGAGNCKGTTVTCAAPTNPCLSAGACNEVDGKCAYSLLADGTPCDDKSPCTGNDVCVTGSCQGKLNCTTPPVGPCYQQVGTCVNNACSYDVTLNATCDDGNACTSGDTCKSGTQCSGNAVTCPSKCTGNQLSMPVCSTSTGCGLGAGSACAKGLTCADATSCRTTCTTNSDAECASGSYCSDGAQCVTKLDPGTVCAVDAQCKSAHCLLSTTGPTKRCSTAATCDSTMCMGVDSSGSCVSTCTGGATCQMGSCVTGTGGAGGAAGASGAAGSSGTAGVAGSSAGGASGASGQAGAAGTSAGGAAGTAGTAGTAGAGGTSGSAGAAGTTSGAAGAGGAGAAGTDGTGGAGGASSGSAGAGG